MTHMQPHTTRDSIHVVAYLLSPILRQAARSSSLLPELSRRGIRVAHTRRETLRQLKRKTSCLLFIDIDAPSTEPGAYTPPQALSWLADLHGRMPHLQSVVLSEKCGADSVIAALCAGACGYLVQDPAMQAKKRINQMLEGLDSLAAGRAPMSPDVMPHLVQAVRATQPGVTKANRAQQPTGQLPHRLAHRDASRPISATPLSKREAEVLNLAAKGFTYAEMARILNLSVHTISTHTRRIYSKLEVNSRSAAIYEANLQGWLKDVSAA